jgi:Tripartite tricarboxylate transporter family receptor
LKRREFITLLGGAAVALPLAARAQQSAHVWRIGILASQPLSPLQRLATKLHEYGYIEGQNLHFVSRFVEGRDDVYPRLAEELGALPVDVHPSLPVKDLKELIALLKANPGMYSYASPGYRTTPHLALA